MLWSTMSKRRHIPTQVIPGPIVFEDSSQKLRSGLLALLLGTRGRYEFGSWPRDSKRSRSDATRSSLRRVRPELHQDVDKETYGPARSRIKSIHRPNSVHRSSKNPHGFLQTLDKLEKPIFRVRPFDRSDDRSRPTSVTDLELLRPHGPAPHLDRPEPSPKAVLYTAMAFRAAFSANQGLPACLIMSQKEIVQ